MCGIVGFTGHRQAAPILLEGLSRLEYRGYDSAGLAVRDGDRLAEVVKATGKLRNLAEKTDNGRALAGACGIGHTRWATHGAPSQTNAHPHVSGNCRRSASGPVESEVVGVHNGIVENYQELKDKLLRHGYTFYSQTDTEVLIKLVDYYYKKYKMGPVDAITKTMVRVRGSYALEVMFKDYPGEIFAARKDSPMIIGIAEGETYVASDVPAILPHTRSVYYIGNLELARLAPGSVTFYDLNGDEVPKEPVEITFSAEAAEKGGFEHFMMKEIHEQPKAIEDTLHAVVRDGAIDLSGVGLSDEEIAGISQLYIVACGSAWHVGMAAQYVFEDLAGLPVRVELASEFRYRRLPLDPKGLVVIVSQSGETADSLAALRRTRSFTPWLAPKSPWLRPKPTRRSSRPATRWPSSSPKCAAPSRNSSTATSSPSCWPCRPRPPACWKIRSASSGSRRSSQTPTTCSLWAAASTTPSASRAA